MRRKVLLVSTLILAMLLQLFLPFTTVKAADSVAVTLNSKLYAAVKKDLQKQDISAEFKDPNCIIILSESELNRITSLDLSEADIDNVLGLEFFKNVTNLDLHANNLTSKSNLQVLDKLPLNNLDLSSNKIDSVKSITSFKSIAHTDITNQEIVGREIITVDDSDEAESQSETYAVQLPDIILEDLDYIRADWVKGAVIKYNEGGPDIEYESINVDGTTLLIKVGLRKGATFTARKGLLMLQIEVNNKDSKLAGTKMTFYYAVVDEEETGVAFNDQNLYKAVKDQLTHNQTMNKEITETKTKTIYTRAYDDALIMVIDTEDVLNNIPTLVLNNKKIKDLTGLEQFFGLRSYLNLSYNFIDKVEKILELEANKEGKEDEIRTKFQDNLTKLKENVTAYDAEQQKIKEAEEAHKKLVEAYKALKDENAQTDNLNKRQEQLNIIAEAKEKAKKYENLIIKYVTKLYKVFKNEYRLLTLLPVDVNTLSYEDLLKLKKDEGRNLANGIMDRVSKLEKGQALTAYETFTIQRLMKEWGSKHGLSFETEKTVYEANGDGTTDKNEKKVAIEYPISEFFDKVKEDETLELSNFQEFIYIFKGIDTLSQIEQYVTITRIFEKDGGEEVAKKALKEIKEFLTQEDYDLYFYNMVNFCETLEEETLNGKQKTEIFAGEGSSDTKGFVFSSKGDVYDMTIGLGESSYKKEDDTNISEKQIILGHRLSVVTSEDLLAYIVIPKIQRLNLENNMIEYIGGLEGLSELKILNLFKNEIHEIGLVKWDNFTKLVGLNLGYNQISDIDPLEDLKTLEALVLSYNLLEGKFNFSMSKMRDLKYADFSHNQYLDIQYAYDQFTLRALSYDRDHDNFADRLTVPEYLKEAGIYLSFQYQDLEVEATIVKSNERFVYLDLPLIFRQLADMDNEHTSFGIDSRNGLVEANGERVKLPIDGEGLYSAKVTVEGRNGFEPEYSSGPLSEDPKFQGLLTEGYSTAGIGYGTTCWIDYEVISGSVLPDNLYIPQAPTNPDEPSVDPGEGPTSYGYKIKNNQAIVYTPEISVTEFATTIADTTKYKVTVTDNNGEGKIATGAVVTISSLDGQTEYRKFDVVVKGDVNGDGEIDRLDSTIINTVIADKTELDGVYKEAADVNDDKDIDSLDSMLVLKYRADRISKF